MAVARGLAKSAANAIRRPRQNGLEIATEPAILGGGRNIDGRMMKPATGMAAWKALAGGLLVAAALIALSTVATPASAKSASQPATAIAAAADQSSGDSLGADSGGDTLGADGDGGDFDNGDAIDTPDPGYIGQAPPDTPDPGPPKDIRQGSFTLEARLTADGPALKDGVDWRIFGDKAGSDGNLPVLGQATGGTIYVRLDPGTYYIHAALGRAGLARKIEVKQPTGGAVFVLNAGGMRLNAMNGKDTPLSGSDISFDIYAPDEGGAGDRYLLMPNAPPGKIIALTAGIYHVVSHYGDANAVVRADIKVDPGKLTEATVYQLAARLTLKLVEVHGGEAIANTEWSVQTPNGDNVVESVGAFPSVVLAAGPYKAIARHDGQTYQSEFVVQPGVNRDVEVLLK